MMSSQHQMRVRYWSLTYGTFLWGSRPMVVHAADLDWRTYTVWRLILALYSPAIDIPLTSKNDVQIGNVSGLRLDPKAFSRCDMNHFQIYCCFVWGQCFIPPRRPANNSAAARCLFRSTSSSNASTIGFMISKGSSSNNWTMRTSARKYELLQGYISSQMDFTQEILSCVTPSLLFSSEKWLDSFFQ